jgi:predicted ATPase with chaperone activity
MDNISTIKAEHVRIDQLGLARLAKLAPRPLELEKTGLSMGLVSDLVSKHILDRGSLTIAELSAALGLTGSIIEQVLNFLRSEAHIEVRPGRERSRSLSYTLTDRGRAGALDAMLRSGYLGPAPVPLKNYAQVVRAQTIHTRGVTQGSMRAAFEDIVIGPQMLDRLGASLNSGRAIFLYGPAGTGKTYISQRLGRLYNELILIPHAIAIDESIVQVFDARLHKVVDIDKADDALMLDRGHDPRFVICERPIVISGGELSGEMLEIRHDPATRLYEAPLQLKANNGLFILDDMGRQKISPMALFNRWIVPLEERRDYLDLGYGKHFSVPFDLVLVFSTNIHPLELADEAFLRRIGYKIEFPYLSPEQYIRIWQNTCREYRITCDPSILKFVLTELHGGHKVPLLPCHPRDLIGMAVDHMAYTDKPRELSTDDMRWAWNNYFVSVGDYNNCYGRQSTN